MKVAELLTEAVYALKYKVAVRLVNELEQMAHDYRKSLAELAGTTIEETPLPFLVHNARTPKSEFPPLVTVIRNSNISDTMWEELAEQVVEFLNEEGYIGGIMPVDVHVVKKDAGAIWMEVA